MACNIPIFVRFGIGVISLSAVIAIYLLVRIYPPEVLVPFQALNADLVSHQKLFGSAPSFFYTLALGLIIGICASSRSSARFHCFSWIVLCLLLEISQYPVIAEPVSGWITPNFPDSISVLINPYWTRGVFDPLDLLATLMGGGIAFSLITRLPLGKINDRAL